MRAGSLRGAPLARLVSAYYAVHAGPCSVIRIASAWRKKLPTRKCGSAYPNCATCSPECCGAGGTALNTCCIGPSGEDDTNSGPCTATIESADRLCPHSIYNCSTNAAARSKGTHFQAVFRRLLPRLGYQSAVWAIAHRLCRLVWKILHEGIRYIEQGIEYEPKLLIHRARSLAKQLRKFGYNVQISPADGAPA